MLRHAEPGSSGAVVALAQKLPGARMSIELNLL